MNRSLKLSEKLFCLAVNPKKGGLILNASSTLGMTLTGSVFVELIKKGIVAVENKVAHLENPSLQSDEIHEFFLRKLRLHGKDRKLRNWISYFNLRKRKIQKLFIRDLVRQNVLRTEEHRILFIPYEKVFLMDRELVDAIRKQVEDAAMRKPDQTDESMILAIMVWRTNLLPQIFPERIQRKEAISNLKKLPETEMSKAVLDAIHMANAAAYAAIS
jgi:hypothetical protein